MKTPTPRNAHSKTPFNLKVKLKSWSDEKIVEAINKQGKTHLFAIIYNRYREKVCKLCSKATKSTAELKDLVQDVFTGLFIKLRSFRGESRFSTWLYAFTRNHCVNYWRRVSVRRHIVSVASLNDPDFFTSRIIARDDVHVEFDDTKKDNLKKALSSIPYKDRDILKLKYFEGASIKSLQKRFRLKSSAVKMRLQRAKNRLAKEYFKLVEE